MKIISAVLLMFLFLPILYFRPISVFAEPPPPSLDTPKLEVLTFDTAKGISSLIKIIIGWAFKLAGVFAFAMIVYAGFQYLTSGGNTTQQKDAQERIVNAIIGIILLFAFYIILYTINPDILREPSKPPPIDIDLGVGPQSFSFPTSSEDTSGAPLKISKECPDGRLLDYGECIPDNNSELMSEESYGKEGWSCEFKGKGPNDAGVYNKPGGTLHLYCLPAPETEPSKNLVNITSMGIPIDNNEFPYPAAFLDSALANKLNSLKNISPSWHVHDACINSNLPCSTSITRRLDDCHLDGTCVDIDSINNSSEDNKKIIATFNKAGLAVLDEGDHLHVALPEASGYGSYPGSDYCITEKECWYGAT